MGNCIGGVLVDAIPGVRVIQEPWVVRRGDLHADLVTRVPYIRCAPEVDFDFVDNARFHELPLVLPVSVSHP